MKLPIYLDNNATTPLDQRVLEAMMPYLTERYGNAASRNHSLGWEAEDAVDKARGQVASLLGGRPEEIVFTSGATESNNLALKGVAEMYQGRGKHVVTCRAEHRAVLDPCTRLEEAGFEVTYLEPDPTGRVWPQQVAEAINDRTILVSLMGANNEVGTVHPVAEIGRVTRDRGVLFHSDATQLVGKQPVDVEAMGMDLLSVSAHKLYGPKGTGCLYVRGRRPRVRLKPQMDGGGHENGLRSGTLNVPGIVGMGEACEIARREMAAEAERLSVLRDRLHSGIAEALPGVKLNGHPERRLPNTLNLSFAGIEAEALMTKLRSLAASSGSACSTTESGPSHVLRAMGVPDALAAGSVRFSLGRFTTAEEIDYAVGVVTRGVSELRELSPQAAPPEFLCCGGRCKCGGDE